MAEPSATWDLTSVIFFHWPKCVQFRFVFLLVLLELWMEWAPLGQQVKRLVHPDKILILKWFAVLPAKLVHCKLKMKGCLLITKTVISVGSSSLFLPFYGNAGMINNQHISVAAFVLYSLNLLGCHLLILNLRRNKCRNRWCSNPRSSEEVKLACDWIYAFCIILYAFCVKIFHLNTKEVFILSLNK